MNVTLLWTKMVIYYTLAICIKKSKKTKFTVKIAEEQKLWTLFFHIKGKVLLRL